MSKRASSWSLGGGVLAGIAASLCCIGPLVSLTLGLGSFAGAAWFAQWRPALLIITFVLLGLAWYLTYRRGRSACTDGSCSREQGSATRAILWLGTSLALGAAVYPALPAQKSKLTAVAAGEANFSVLIPTMDCPPCAAGIESSLRQAPGVRQATVDYESKAAELVYDPAITNPDRLLALIDSTGFPADRSTLK